MPTPLISLFPSRVQIVDQQGRPTAEFYRALNLLNNYFANAITAGTFGDATQSAKVTVNSQGQVTAIEQVPINLGGANFVGDLAGRTVTIVNGVITEVV